MRPRSSVAVAVGPLDVGEEKIKRARRKRFVNPVNPVKEDAERENTEQENTEQADNYYFLNLI
jgi:hypothetical protein